MKKEIIQKIVLFMLICFCAGLLVSAEESPVAYNSFLNGSSLQMMIGNVEGVQDVSCQIGNARCDEISWNMQVPMETYVLMDNSLSIEEKYRETIRQILFSLIDTMSEQEKMTIAVFDLELHYLLEGSNDKEALKQTVEGIAHENKYTKVTDVMYSLYRDLENTPFDGIRRIILISDGAEDSNVGFTRQEMLDKVQKLSYPVYTLGCTYGENTKELENMFSLSRMTGAESVWLDEESDIQVITNLFNKCHNSVQVRVEIPDRLGDGTEKGIKIDFRTEDGEKSVSTTAVMPFIEIQPQTETQEETATELSTEARSEEPEPETALALSTEIPEAHSESAEPETVSEPSTEAQPEPSTVNEPLTEAQPEPSTVNEPLTEAQSEPSIVNEPSTEAQSETATVNEPSTEIQPEKPEPATVNESSTEVQTEETKPEPISELLTEVQSEPATVSEPPTEAQPEETEPAIVNEPLTEIPTEESENEVAIWSQTEESETMTSDSAGTESQEQNQTETETETETDASDVSAENESASEEWAQDFDNVGETEETQELNQTDSVLGETEPSEKSEEDFQTKLILVGIIILLLIFLLIRKKKKKQIAPDSGSEKTFANYDNDKTGIDDEEPTMLPDETDATVLDEGNTMLIDEEESTAYDESRIRMNDFISIRLTDIRNPARMIEAPLYASLNIGRTSNNNQVVFDYERSVSSQHCKMIRRGNRIYIRDINSLNGTWVNGERVEEMELTDGSILKLGRLEVKFEIL